MHDVLERILRRCNIDRHASSAVSCNHDGSHCSTILLSLRGHVIIQRHRLKTQHGQDLGRASPTSCYLPHWLVSLELSLNGINTWLQRITRWKLKGLQHCTSRKGRVCREKQCNRVLASSDSRCGSAAWDHFSHSTFNACIKSSGSWYRISSSIGGSQHCRQLHRRRTCIETRTD